MLLAQHPHIACSYARTLEAECASKNKMLSLMRSDRFQDDAPRSDRDRGDDGSGHRHLSTSLRGNDLSFSSPGRLGRSSDLLQRVSDINRSLQSGMNDSRNRSPPRATPQHLRGHDRLSATSPGQHQDPPRSQRSPQLRAARASTIDEDDNAHVEIALAGRLVDALERLKSLRSTQQPPRDSGRRLSDCSREDDYGYGRQY